MSKLAIHHYEVTFEANETCSGGSFIAIAVAQGAGPLAPGTILFLEPKEGITLAESARMAEYLTNYTARFSIAMGAPEVP